MLSKISQHSVNSFVLDTFLNCITVCCVREGIRSLQSFSVLGLKVVMRKVTTFPLCFGEGSGGTECTSLFRANVANSVYLQLFKILKKCRFPAVKIIVSDCPLAFLELKEQTVLWKL